MSLSVPAAVFAAVPEPVPVPVPDSPSPLRWLAAALLAVTACSSEPEAPREDWQLVFEGLPGALLSVWGTSPNDVWTVGGDPDDGSGPMVLHFDGSEWRRHETGEHGDLWWVYGFEDGPVFMGGKDGLILRYRDGAFERMQTPGTNTVFGLWGSAPDDMWAVGGAGSTPSGGFVWRSDGSAWREAEGVPAELATSATLFKLWGHAADDVWIVGTDGVLVHYDGARFATGVSPDARTLYTVHGDDSHAFAVGGNVSGVLLEREGGDWKDVTPERTPQLNGVYVGGAAAYAVGVGGSIYANDGRAWERADTKLPLSEDLHSVWVDAEGGVWSVGGQLVSMPMVQGVLVHRGAQLPDELSE